MSHKTLGVISEIINKVNKHFEDQSIVRGENHTLLAINIEIQDNIILVDILENLEDCITMFGEDVSTSASSPATKVSEVREYDKQLIEKKGELFHLVVAKLLFIMRFLKPGLETIVSFLATRVSKSDINYW